MGFAKRVALVVLGVVMIVAGVNHFASPDFYVAMMPPYLPAHLELVYLSGLAEIALGVGVLVPRTRRLSAWGLIALFVAVFPANIHMAIHDIPLGGAEQGAGVWNWVRLPFQAVFIAWAWWFTRPDPAPAP